MEINTIAGSCIIKNDRILLLKESDEWKDGSPKGWGPPAGRGKVGEKLLETAIRETKEECNLDVEAVGIVESGIYRTLDKRNYLIVIYLCRAIDLKQLKIDKVEITDYKWATKEELISNKFKLRHPMLQPILLKALNKQAMPLSAFMDVDIKV